ncbi:tripartite tricarboxylate transporter substrate binding protein [Ramlibacter sp. AW1]|uniref:Tripartite tricarboxylate transporter substrate binding protein n=1 Tax=Ramlibacter aurantiacus TaxID=2801330 RepID=A0A936ZYG7_9BURK|nr:tripartite tricarboxylate transporter substrate binding protein [Ramlibacter aurantiacus]MBL0423375.1 tripartite tricarboxylate transporter substrate binding protein [Ramlibacter aurantiacus]
MIETRRAWLAFALASLFAGAPAVQAQAQDFPGRPVKIVVPLPPGGTPDFAARQLAGLLAPMWGQPVVVENKPGAAGNIAAESVARSAPDGYTLFLIVNFIPEINPHLYSKLSYDPLKDLQSITLLGTIPFVLVANPGVPAASAKDLPAVARSRPQGISYATSGPGSNQHLFAEQMRAATGMPMLHVPYKGGAPAMVDLLAGVVDISFASVNQVVPHVKAGKLKALGVTGNSRSPLLPQVPTLAEAGFPGFENEPWVALSAPAGLPPAVAARIERDVREVMKRPEVVAALHEQGVTVNTGTREQLDQRIQAGHASWGRIIKGAQIRAE